MRNRLFAVPLKESDRSNKCKSNDWGTLKNKFSGGRLFRYSYFSLICGDFSVLESNKNKWFLEEILNECSKGDINLLPVLKKISSDKSLDNGIRQRSSEISEIAEIKLISETEEKSSDIQGGKEKLLNARKTLAGIRIPQTTEVLRLLRDKSLESKRLGIFMIGKFKLTSMLPEVCECLNISGLEEDTVVVLRSFGNEAGDELHRFYLKSSGNVNIAKTIIRLLSNNNTEENVSFLFELLWSTSRQIKEAVLECLVSFDFKTPEEGKARVNQVILKVVNTLAWLLSAKVCLRKVNNEFLLETVDKEYARWKQFLFRINSITYSAVNPADTRNSSKVKENDNNKHIREMVDVVFGETRMPFRGVVPDSRNDEKRLKKLRRFFPGEIQDFYELAEEIINCDYNIVSIWTKACTLRNLTAVRGESLGDSVIALLFSQEEILQEEAVKLAARSDREFYKSASHRIPDKTKLKLDKIISGKTEERELLFEKTKFLSSVFSGIPGEELLLLAGELKYIKNIGEEFALPENKGIIWINLPDKAEPDVIILNDDLPGNLDDNRFNDKRTSCYVLSFGAIEAFHNLYPEQSFGIMKYIDENEKQN